MKINNAVLLSVLIVFGALASLPVLADSTSNTPSTYVVKDGAFPWYDRVNVWQLLQVPSRLSGNGPLIQQSCASRSINVPAEAKSIVFAVSHGDVDKLRASLPAVQDTGDSLAVVHPDGTGAISYTVFKLSSPPSIIGDSSFGAGVILLQVGEKPASTGSTTSTSSMNTPTSSGVTK